MTPKEFKQIREHLKMEPADFGTEIGLGGSERNRGMRIKEYERGKREIPQYLARLAWLLQEHYDAEEEHLPDWPPSCANNNETGGDSAGT
jgi:hypothetical protein